MFRTATRGIVIVTLGALVALGCSRARIDTTLLASDALNGRQNNTAGSLATQDYLISQLREMGAVGLNAGATGDEAFKQHFDLGTNILGVIPGTALPGEYVMVGGHYDHLGTGCRLAGPADSVCNGATDNAAGTAAALAVGRTATQIPGGPRRSVIIALWDREEDGLLGSAHYVENPLVPLAATTVYLNFDIVGANLIPSLRNSTFAIGGETGGSRLQTAIDAAVDGALQVRQLSTIFGQGRSDYINFTGKGVPNVFFGDATGPCYHTVDDEIEIVDWRKLDRQVGIAARLTVDLINGTRPPFVGNAPLASFADAVAINTTVNSAVSDLDRFTPAQQTTLLQFRSDLNGMVAAGEAQFDQADVNTLLGGAASAVSILATGACDGFLAP